MDTGKTKNKQTSTITEALSGNLQLLPLIMDNIPQAVFWKDQNLVYLGCNQAFAEDAGLDSPTQIIGKTDYDMPWTDQAELYREDDAQVMESGQAKINYEEPQTSPSGDLTWLRTSKIPMKDEAGNVIAVLGMYEDITEQKRAEQLLRDNEERLQAIYEGTNDAVMLLTPAGFFDCNPRTLELFGFETVEEFTKVHPADISPPHQPDGSESFPAVQERIQTAYEQGHNRFDWIHRRTNGDDFPAEVLLSAFEIQGETVLQATVRDISERKQVKSALEQSELLLQSFIDNFPDGVWAKDLEGRFLLANRYVVEEIAGTDVIGKTVFDTMPKDVADFVWESEKRLLETGEPVSVEEDVPHADGTIHSKITTKFPLYDAEGNISGVGGVLTDITERKQANEAIRQNEDRFRRFTEATAEGLVFHEEGEIIDVNPAAIAMFGFSDPTELIGKNLFEFIPSEFHKLVLKQMKLETVQPYEIQGIHKDGYSFPIETSTRTYEVDDKTIRASSVRDITERQKLVKQVQEAFERRGYQVQISTEIAQEISGATALDELFQLAVNLTKERLGYYHTQLLRFQPTQDAVVLITGYGDIGEEMLAQGHRMSLGSGLIGTAAENGETMMRPDLAVDPDWHPHPLLPETRGEIAVPIKLGDEILGVLDVQSDQAGALTEDDQLLLESLCGQIAIAIEQTRLRQEMEERLTEINRLYRAMSREGWESYTSTTTLPEGFQYDQSVVRVVDIANEQEHLVSAPLTVPGGHTIGTLSITDDPNNPLSQGDRAFLEQVSEQVALALESARLFEQTQSALAAVQESEAQLGEALKIARLGNFEYDVENDLFTFNDHFYAIFHVTAEEVGGYQMSSQEYSERFVHPDELPVVGEAIGKALNSTERHYTTNLEHRILYGDGGEGYISVNVNVERDEDGNITRYYGANQDITERRQAEEAVRQAQERAQTILETVTLPMVITRLSDNILTFANPPATEIVGLTMEDFINQPAPNFYANPDERTQFVSELQSQGFVNNMQVVLMRGDQSTFWALLSARVFTYQGEPSILTTITDISERIEAQEATAKRAAELATVAEVGTTISTILEEQPLIETVVQQTQERFELYHCHIFLADAKNQTLQVKACGWDAGSPHIGTVEQSLIHTDQEQSLVAQAARDQKAVIVNNVRKDPNWLPNELLPETHAEMAVPLIAGNQVLGVLDVQSDEVDRFTEEDVSIMTTLASQVAVALQNSRTYAQTQQQAEYEAMINQISQRIQSTTNVENALQVAIRELGRALGAKRTNIQLGLPSQKKSE